MPRQGGPRQGTPGRSYQNRSDLNQRYAGQTGLTTAAAGGIQPPAAAAPAGHEQHHQMPIPTPQQVPALDDPSARPEQPVTHGLDGGPGANSLAIGAQPIPPELIAIQAAYQAYPTPELQRTVEWLYAKGILT